MTQKIPRDLSRKKSLHWASNDREVCSRGGEFVLEKRKKIEPKRCIPGHQQQNVIFGPSSSMVRVSFRGKSTLFRGCYSHSALKNTGGRGRERERDIRSCLSPSSQVNQVMGVNLLQTGLTNCGVFMAFPAGWPRQVGVPKENGRLHGSGRWG